MFLTDVKNSSVTKIYNVYFPLPIKFCDGKKTNV